VKTLVPRSLEEVTAAKRRRNCGLWRNAALAVFGAGRQQAKIMYVGAVESLDLAPLTLLTRSSNVESGLC
jgi:hypothetical protein